ncbi:BPM1, partial [Symbiodinium pilosum]
MLYSPDAGQLIGSHHGSLALFYRTHVSVPVYEEISCQYSLYIKARDGSFVQLGETGHGRYDSEVAHDWREVCFGPDVHWEGHRPATLTALGIFGLTHEQLLQSEWVQNDTLTVKCLLEVRPRYFDSRLSVGLSAELPGPSIVRDMQALFEKGTNSDVRFMVEGEVIHAHSAVLCQRSDVLESQLTTGMQESISKVIVIEDCSARIFRAFLKFLYTDNLPSVEELAAQVSCSAADDDSWQLKEMQALLAVSH